MKGMMYIMMSVDEIIIRNEEQCKQCQKYLANALTIGNSNVILNNYSGLFDMKLKIGILKWRANLGNPKRYFNDVIDITRNMFIDIGIYFDDVAAEKMFYFSPALILSYLTGKKLILPNYNTSDLDLEQKLTLALVNSLNGNKNHEEWETLLNKKVPSRQNLMMETYKLYYKLLFENNPEKIDMLVKEGEKLYIKRSKDSFYTGGPAICGGGEYNDLAVDYELGAVLKYISYSGDSIHKWRWD